MHFLPKFLKIVATRGEIFSLKFTKYRLSAGLCPDPLGELKCSPRLHSRNKGGLLLRDREGKGKERGELAPRCWGDRHPCPQPYTMYLILLCSLFFAESAVKHRTNRPTTQHLFQGRRILAESAGVCHPRPCVLLCILCTLNVESVH